MKRIGIGVLLALLAAGGVQATPRELSTPERAAAFRAAGFKHWPDGWTRCQDDPSASHMWGTLEVDDLNGDGVLEAWIRESSAFCYGDTAEAFVLVTRKSSGWTVLLDEVGVPLSLETMTRGWPDIEVGGPGLGKMPVYRFNGTKYVRK